MIVYCTDRWFFNGLFLDQPTSGKATVATVSRRKQLRLQKLPLYGDAKSGYIFKGHQKICVPQDMALHLWIVDVCHQMATQIRLGFPVSSLHSTPVRHEAAMRRLHKHKIKSSNATEMCLYQTIPSATHDVPSSIWT